MQSDKKSKNPAEEFHAEKFIGNPLKHNDSDKFDKITRTKTDPEYIPAGEIPDEATGVKNKRAGWQQNCIPKKMIKCFFNLQTKGKNIRLCKPVIVCSSLDK